MKQQMKHEHMIYLSEFLKKNNNFLNDYNLDWI